MVRAQACTYGEQEIYVVYLCNVVFVYVYVVGGVDRRCFRLAMCVQYTKRFYIYMLYDHRVINRRRQAGNGNNARLDIDCATSKLLFYRYVIVLSGITIVFFDSCRERYCTIN